MSNPFAPCHHGGTDLTLGARDPPPLDSLYRVTVDTRQHVADDAGAESLASIKPPGALTTILWENCPRIADAQ
jgi:hypothetical protein